MKLLICTQIVDRTDPVLGFFHEWIAEFARQAESVEVICLKEGKHELPPNVHVHTLGKEKGTSRLTRIFRFHRYAFGLRNNYDAVFVHMNPEYVVLGGVWWRLRAKTIGLWYAHGAVTQKLKLAAQLANHLFTSTPQGLRITSPKIHLVGQGIDIERFSPQGEPSSNSAPLKIVTVSRISRSKDIGLLIDVASLLQERGVDVALSIVGGPLTADDGGYQNELQKKVEEKGLTAGVHFLGPLPNAALPILLRKQDVFVNAYKNQSLDKALLEAMATGLPVVSSNASYRDLIAASFGEASEESQLCVEEGRAGQFADALELLVASGASARRELGVRLRGVVVREHGLPDFVRRIMRFYTLHV